MNKNFPKLPTAPHPQRAGLGLKLEWLSGHIFGDRMLKREIRARLLIGALLVGTLPLLVASIIVPMRVRTVLTATGHEHLGQVAQDLATLTQNEFKGHLDTLLCLASVKSLAQALQHRNAGTLGQTELVETNDQLHAFIRELDDEFQGLFVSGADGVIFAGVLKNGETGAYVDLDIRDRDYFNEVRTTLKPVISDMLKSKVGAVPIIVIAVPMRDDRGAFAGMIGLSVETDHLTSMISGQKLGRTGYPFAIDRHGAIVAHPDPKRAFRDLGTIPGAERLATRMVSGETGVENYVSSTGANKIAAFAPVPIAGWSVAASMETSEFVGLAQRVRRIIFVTIGAGMLIALVVTVFFAMGLEALKKSLAEARTSEMRFKLLASVSNETIWDWNLQTDDLWWNKGVATVNGCAPGEVENAGLVFDRWVPAAERETVKQGLRSCIAGTSWAGEHHFHRQDGTLAYVLHRATAVRDAGGSTLRVIGSMTDITERRATENKLAEQAALLDQARDGILVRDLSQVIQFWNRGAERLYGWTAAEAIGCRLNELLRVDAARFAEAEHQVLQNGEWSGQLQKTTRTGSVLTLDCRWTLLRDDQGRPRSVLIIDTDISDRKQMEAKFLRAQRLESIGTLAGGIAHDLNNLLAPIVMGVGLLKITAAGEEDREVIQHIERSARRGTELVKQVLSFARGIEGARVSVHIGYVAREAEAIVRSTFPKNITLRMDIAKDVWLVTADPTQLNQVLLNLCVNARDAMPAGGQLTISATNIQLDEHFARMNRDVAPGSYVLIEVADTGTGMSKEVLEKLFEPFFTTKAPGKGTGLGLSTVIGITRSHGGTINVYSEPGKGSVFKVYLPAALSAMAGREFSDEENPSTSGHGELILLVDDEPTILSVTEQALTSFGYKVLTAADGAQAFSLYLQHRTKISLVLTDMMMPVMDGSALIAAMRSINPNVLVVASSGMNDNNNQIKAADAAIKHFLCKPYTTTSLMAVLNAALSENRPTEVQPANDHDTTIVS